MLGARCLAARPISGPVGEALPHSPAPLDNTAAVCDPLEDAVIPLLMRAGVDVETWGFGTVLAGGSKGWFLTMPASADSGLER